MNHPEELLLETQHTCTSTQQLQRVAAAPTQCTPILLCVYPTHTSKQYDLKVVAVQCAYLSDSDELRQEGFFCLCSALRGISGLHVITPAVRYCSCRIMQLCISKWKFPVKPPCRRQILRRIEKAGKKKKIQVKAKASWESTQKNDVSPFMPMPLQLSKFIKSQSKDRNKRRE